MVIGVAFFLSLLQIKCDQYWPNRGSETYGGVMHVNLVDIVELATYTIRTFQILRVSHLHIHQTTFWVKGRLWRHAHSSLQTS